MAARASFRCCYCGRTRPLAPDVWAEAYRSVLDHVATCGPRAGAGNDEMREYISAVMADWPETARGRRSRSAAGRA